METKEAINWVFDIWHEWENVYGVSGEQVLEEGKKMDEVIELLKRGEKYEKIVNDLRAESTDWDLVEWGTCNKTASRRDLESAIDKLEQKYFPPKPSDNFTEKVMEKINKEADNET